MRDGYLFTSFLREESSRQTNNLRVINTNGESNLLGVLLFLFFEFSGCRVHRFGMVGQADEPIVSKTMCLGRAG